MRDAIAAGEAVPRSEADQLAAAVLTSAPVRLAGALADANARSYHRVLLELVEAILDAAPATGTASRRERGRG